MVTGVYPTIPLDVVEATWLVRYPERMVLSTELIGLQALALAKQLSHYLYFFSFLSLFFYLGLATQKEVWEKCHITSITVT